MTTERTKAGQEIEAALGGNGKQKRDLLAT